MEKFPLHFEVKAHATSGLSSTWQAVSDCFPPISCAIPPEFQGPGGAYSPEDFFALALLNCLIATYKVYMAKEGISFSKIEGKATLTVNKSPETRGIQFEQIDVQLDVQQTSNPQKAKELLERAIQNCAVSRAIQTGKTFHTNVS